MRRLIATVVLALSLGASTTALAAGSPTVTTGAASSVTNTSATVNGTVNPNGQTTSYTFQYGTTNKYGQQTAVAPAGSGSTPQAVSASLSNLQSGTTYHYRILATNASGTAVGTDATFKTTGTPPSALPAAPTVTESPATAIKRNGVTLNGTVNPKGAPTTYYFELGLTSNYGTQTKSGSIPAGSSTQTIKATLQGLEAGKTYHYRLVANNAGGTTVGQDRTFKTGPARAGTKITAKTTPRSSKSLPKSFATSGRLIPAKGRSTKRACSSGRMQITFMAGNQVLSKRRVNITKSCTYFSRTTVKAPSKKSKGKYNVRVTVRFLGNAFVQQTTGPSQVIKIG